MQDKLQQAATKLEELDAAHSAAKQAQQHAQNAEAQLRTLTFEKRQLLTRAEELEEEVN